MGGTVHACVDKAGALESSVEEYGVDFFHGWLFSTKVRGRERGEVDIVRNLVRS